MLMQILRIRLKHPA